MVVGGSGRVDRLRSAAMTQPQAPFTTSPAELELEPWPLEPEQILGGEPQVSGTVLHESADGRIERGVWQHTPGVSSDVEADELFVVISGRATIEIEGGPTLTVGPGDAAVLRAGDRTVRTVHETLRKGYPVTR